MDRFEFVAKLERTWLGGKSLDREQSQIYSGKLVKFTDPELDGLFDKLTESCKYLPRIADIWEAATDIGLLNRQQLNKPEHTWTRSECKRCNGEGLLLAYFVIEYEEVVEGEGEQQRRRLKRHRRFTGLYQYSDVRSIWAHTSQPGEYRYVFRCDCELGMVPTLARGWPQWRNDRQETRTQILSDTQEKKPDWAIKSFAEHAKTTQWWNK